MAGFMASSSIAVGADFVIYSAQKTKTKEVEQASKRKQEISEDNKKLEVQTNKTFEYIKMLGRLSDFREIFIAELKNNNTELRRTINELTKEVDILETVFTVWNASKEKLEEKYKNLLNTIEELEEERKGLNRTMKTFKELYNTLGNYVVALDNEVGKLNDLNQKLNDEIKELEKNKTEYFRKNKELHLERIILNGTIEMQMIHITNLTKWINKLKLEVQELKVGIGEERLLIVLDDSLRNTFYKEFIILKKNERNKNFAIAAKNISNVFLKAALGLNMTFEAEENGRLT